MNTCMTIKLMIDIDKRYIPQPISRDFFGTKVNIKSNPLRTPNTYINVIRVVVTFITVHC